jgi:rSAM/selenodomain-associated transferase 1
LWSRLQTLRDIVLYFYSDAPWDERQHLCPASEARLQKGTDLGERMLHCFEELNAEGHERLLIVGSDLPTLPLSPIEEGLANLESADAVLGPCEDGGYYAVGCRRPHPEMFRGVTWSSRDTLQETRTAFDQVGYRVHLLPPWYDIDTVADLRRLLREGGLPTHTAEWFAARPKLVERIFHG